MRAPRRIALAALAGVALVAAPLRAEPAPARQRELVRMVRQDCGSCHGMRLTGGLGPALTREALAGQPVESIVAVIVHGRPGTPMPPWGPMLGDGEALWIAKQLRAGMPPLPGDTR
jgi:cytochrome c55X